MIVWLASYPRSGNTLLRQVLKQCLGLDSFEQPGGIAARPDEDAVAWQEIRAAFGNRFATQGRDAFLTQARESSGTVLVKTHELPDGEPEKAIYVVRDGRLAIQSYVKYQQNFQGGASSFAALLLGDHVYRDWTTHYRLWCDRRRGPLMLVRFEELVDADAGLLGRLADFLGHDGEVRPWVNQQEKLRKLSPAFFGAGASSWQPDEFWTVGRLRQFLTLHGGLARQLGYVDEATLAEGAYPAGGDEAELLRQAWEVTQSRWELQQVCDERDQCLNLLRDACDKQAEEAEMLRNVCVERLGVITRLDETASELRDALARAQGLHAEEVARLREEAEQLRPLEGVMAAWRKAKAWLPGRVA